LDWKDFMIIEDLAVRPDALKDRMGIKALISGYANAFDRANVPLLRRVWHADATLDLPGFGNAWRWQKIAGNRWLECITG
jgi:hypothetical protein